MRGFEAIRDKFRLGLPGRRSLSATGLACATVAVVYWGSLVPASAQVLTVGPEQLPKQYTDFHPTSVPLSNQPMDGASHQQVIRALDAEQGFATRPLVRGHRGIVLRANGEAKPAGSDYARALQQNGISVDAGQRVVVTNLTVDKDRIVFELNGGPDHKHRILRHIQIGANGGMVPMAQDEGADPAGSRVTLVFDKFVPHLSGEQVEQLLAPVIDFAVKTPAEAYTDTLPPKLKATILAHHVLVGMDRQMVVAALGPPPRKSRERDGDLPFEEWIYGEPPQDVQFIRVNGNRVIRVEIAKSGQSPEIRAENEMGDYWSTTPDSNTREIKLGDSAASHDPDKAAAPPPSLGQPGDPLPDDRHNGAHNGDGNGAHNPDDLTMKPVHFPQPDPEPVTTVPPIAAPASPDPDPAPAVAPTAVAPAAQQP